MADVCVNVVFNQVFASIVTPETYTLQLLCRRALKEHKDRPSIPSGALGPLVDRCQCFKVNPPVEIGGRQEADIIAECQDRAVRENEVFKTTEIGDVVQGVPRRCVHLFIKTVSPENATLFRLNRDHTQLFKRLQIVVVHYKSWTEDDVRNNLGPGGTLYRENRSAEPFRSIEDQLKQKRIYSDTPGADLNLARRYEEQFCHIFTAAAGGVQPSVKNTREFVAFYNVHRCWLQDAPSVAEDRSSALKCSTFSVYFAVPPFLSCSSGTNIRYQPEMNWQFPLFIHRQDNTDTFCKFHPRSDFGVVHPEYLCPLVISETISDGNESDRWRMLIEAIAAARAGHFLMKSNAEERFFVVAIYLRRSLEAERYIVMQTSADEGNPVSIIKKTFDLTVTSQSSDFFLEMFNLTTMLSQLTRNLDAAKKGALKSIKDDAKGLRSLSSVTHPRQTSANRTTLASVPEGHEGEAEDDLGVFEADDIQEKVQAMGYEVTFRVFGHPNIAHIENISDFSQHGYLKFVARGQKEAEILQYLSSFNTLSNHTINGISIWPVSNGTIIYMPEAGGWLTSLKNPNDKLWSVAKQLFEGIDFMHSHGVAHLDIKPGNILVPHYGGRLSVIDYNRAVRITEGQGSFRGVVGTEGYMAPEVAAGSGLWNAVRADLWSTGKTLEELCMRCDRSAPGREALLAIARRLMNAKPADRPTMSEVLQWMSQLDPQSNVDLVGTVQLEHSVLQQVAA